MSVLSERDRLTIQAALARSAQAITHVVETIPQLRAKMSAWERGGHRSSSIPEAIAQNGSAPELRVDPFDRRMRQDIRVLVDEVLEIEKASGRVWRLVGSYILPAAAVTDDEELTPCKNPPCVNLVRVRVERTCSRCRKTKSRTGKDWSPKRGVA